MAQLYQQGVQKIEVIVKKQTTLDEDKGAKQTSGEVSNQGEDTEVTARYRGGMSDRRAMIYSTHILATAKQVGNQILNYQVSGLGYRTGDQSNQDIVNRQIEIFQDYTNVVSSITMGIAFGATGGPVGMAIGAVLGATNTISSIVIREKGRQRDFDYSVFKENNAIQYNRSRAGINWTNGRLR